MTIIKPIGDLEAGDHIAVGQHHEIPVGRYTVAEVEPFRQRPDPTDA